ncbi:D-2-hydroxyacid dehydrogenase [Desulfuromonas sp. TF]|uniref:D-2-hydroxyacid dehydrogenase n=1 Tax=Desulfuromonas sp. TF TaxID=1232410 RepID=UPI00042090E2|nr:D-2-hydroxyacid dehydrogenase [Desulfuromonas sp. TF]
MNIVVLDGYTLNPGDLSWEGLERLGSCDVFDRTPAAQVAERAKEAEIVLTNKAVLNREIIGKLPRLRYIGVLATGYNVVDLEAARAQGVVVTNVPAYSTVSVAQMVFALLLELTSHVGHHAGLVRRGRWSESPDFCFRDTPLIELEGLIMGIIGFGQIGRRVARIADAFGMRVLVQTRNPARYKGNLQNAGIEFVELVELLRRSDVVSLHCPLTPETERMIDVERLALMKPTAFLINTGRGPLVDEAALAAALNGKRLAGAGLDVLSQEPPPADNPLLHADNCFITPHIAWATKEARERLMKVAVDNVRAFLEGGPHNVVS